MNLDDVNERLGTELSSEDYGSLGGFIIEHLDRLPELNDEVVTEDGIRLVVETLDKNRIESVHVYLPEKNDDEEDAPGKPDHSGTDDSSSKADDNGDFSSEVIDEDNSHIKDSAENTSGTEKS